MNEVAIVIPAYNAEKGLERSVRSALAQTMREIEVWVTDDGSTDRTGKIADRLAAEDSRVRVIHQENGGCYQARLAALKKISAPWFGFLDADDTIEPTMFERMVAACETNNLDCVQCGIMRVGEMSGRNEWEWDNGGEVSNSAVPLISPTPTLAPKILEGESLERHKFHYLVDTREGCFIWDKLYRNQYDFAAFDPTDRVTNFEDMIFNLQFFLKVGRMGFLNEPLYHYATTAGSAVHSFSESKLKDFREVCRVRRELLPRYGVDPDGGENRAWFKLNRMNCVKATIRAGNLSVLRKVSIVRRLFMMGR